MPLRSVGFLVSGREFRDLALEVGARILAVAVEEYAVEVGRQIVMMRHVAPRPGRLLPQRYTAAYRWSGRRVHRGNRRT
jgi:hypothetical protein